MARSALTEASFPMQGRWLRCDDYTIEDGYVRAVGESPEDFEEYSPWKEFYEARTEALHCEVGERISLASPYMSLLRLADSLPAPGTSEPVLTHDQEVAIIDWYREHGSLGLLSQRTSTAVLYPGMDLAPEDVEHDDGTIEFVGVPALSQVAYMRTSRGWVSDRNYVKGSTEALRSQEGGKITIDIREPMVIMTPLGRSRPHALPLAEGWGPYFPEVPAGFAGRYFYPLPNTPEFWLSSGEPIGEFIAAVHMLGRVAMLGRGGESGGVPRRPRLLEALLAPAGVSVIGNAEGAFFQRWQAPSLLGIYAMMMLRDLTTENAPLRICRNCSAPFVSPRSYYCSDKCGNAYRVRICRGWKWAAELRVQGYSDLEIAETMSAKTGKKVTVEDVEKRLKERPPGSEGSYRTSGTRSVAYRHRPGQ